MLVVNAYLPGRPEPVSLQEFIEFIVDVGQNRDDAQAPDYLQFDTPEWGVEAVKNELTQFPT